MFLDGKIAEVIEPISYVEKEYIEFRDLSRSFKQTDEEDLIEGAMKTTIQKLYDKGLFSRYDNADEVLKDYLLIENNVDLN